MDYPDIYFLPKWAELNQTLDDGVSDSFYFRNENGSIYYPFIKRKVDVKIGHNQYFDLITPFGFNGPCVIESGVKTRTQLVKDFDSSFKEYCNENKIIAEYVRFSPWLKNKDDFEHYYSLRESDITLYIDLSCPDFFMDEFTSDCRNKVRRSLKSNLQVEFDYDGHSLNEFESLYNTMAITHDLPSYYRFKIDYLRRLFECMEGNVLLINIIYHGAYISSSIFLHYENTMHYHLSANDPSYFHLSGNHLILYEACKWGKEHGVTKLHLGGGGKDEHAKPILHFKKQFTKNESIPFYVGYRVLNERIYNQLVLKSGSCNDDYFPKYRG